jgi:hypothetical protein
LVTCIAMLDVPRHVVAYLARLLAAQWRRISTPHGSQARGPFRQAVLVLPCSVMPGACTAWPATPEYPRPPATDTSTMAGVQ